MRVGQRAPMPFVDNEKAMLAMEGHEQAALMGRSLFRLWKEGIVEFRDIVTPSRIRTLEQVTALRRLSIKAMIEAGVSPSIARAAYNAVHTPEHEQAAAHRRDLLHKIADAGVAQDLVIRHLTEKVANRATIAPGATYTTKAGAILPGIPGGETSSPAAVRAKHAEELKAILGSKEKAAKAVAALKKAPPKPKPPKVQPPPVAPPAAAPKPAVAPPLDFDAAMDALDAAHPVPAIGTPKPAPPKVAPPKVAAPVLPPPEPIPAKPAVAPKPAASKSPAPPPNPKTRAERAKVSEAWRAGLTPDEKEGVVTYTSHVYQMMNKYLRTGQLPPEVAAAPNARETLDRHVARLDAAMAKAHLDRPLTVWRGVADLKAVGLDPANLVGSTITDRAFLSTTLERGKAEFFAHESPKGAVFRIVAPEGSNGAFIAPISTLEGEQEVLFNRGTSLRITGAKRNKDGIMVIDAEVIGHGE